MNKVFVDTLDFHFPSSWKVSKYDEWDFYHDRFKKIANGIKAIDLIAVDADMTVWLIEVKDYRKFPRTKPSEIHQEIALKVIYTLSAMLPGKLNCKSEAEKEMCDLVCSCKKLKIILHLEQPPTTSKLMPKPIEPANVKQKLKQALNSIDMEPHVVSMDNMGKLVWSVTSR